MKTRINSPHVISALLSRLLLLAALFISTIGSAHAGIIYTAHYGSNRIDKFDSVTGANLGVFASGLGGPVGLAFDGTGNLFVSGYSNGTITKITSAGVASTFATGLDRPYYMAFDSTGNLFTANAGTGTSGSISKFTPGGASSVFAASISGYVNGLAFDGSGNLYASRHAANGSGGSILKYNSAGGSLGVFASGFDYSQDIEFDVAGNLYVAQLNSDIMKVTPGGVVSSFSTVKATGIAFDSTGNLFAAGFGGQLNRIPGSGGSGVLVTSLGGGGDTYGIAFAPVAATVPEPGTLALLAVSSGALAWTRRRRRAVILTQ